MLALTVLLALASSPPPDLAALGVVISRSSERSVAILGSGGRTRLVGIGENAFGGRVAAISQGAVTLEFDAQLVELRLPANLAAAALPAPAVLPPASLDPPEDPETPARSMARREVDRRLGSEMARILTETTIVPVTEEGRVVGFNVTRLPEGSLLADAGLRAGDVLMRINDVPIDSLATLIALWPRLQNESHLRAVVLRNGRPVSLAVTLK